MGFLKYIRKCIKHLHVRLADTRKTTHELIVSLKLLVGFRDRGVQVNTAPVKWLKCPAWLIGMEFGCHDKARQRQHPRFIGLAPRELKKTVVAEFGSSEARI